ncbi:MAG TPA: hypothetical protein VFU02_14875 [Polyangiaceae bacterium]|nr:hypothetical protein [Polyangiaceae bacterium]
MPVREPRTGDGNAARPGRLTGPNCHLSLGVDPYDDTGMGDALGLARARRRRRVSLAFGISMLAFGLLASCGGDDSGSGSTGNSGGMGGSAGEGGTEAEGGSSGTGNGNGGTTASGGTGNGGTTASGGSTSASGGSSGDGAAGASGAAGDDGGPSSQTEIGPDGGSVTGPDGIELVIPAGALEEPVLFSITKDPSDAPATPAGVAWVGSVYAIEPHGTEFAEPATLHLPFDDARVPDELTPAAYEAEPGGAFVPVVDGGIDSETIELELNHLSFFSAGIPFSFLGTLKPSDVAAYPGGGAVVVGIAAGATRVIKVNESGAISWDRTTQGTATFTAGVPRVAVGPTGNVYVATATNTDEAGASLGQAAHLRITSYNASGDVRDGWPVRVSIGTYNYPTDIVTDVQDNVYFVGTAAPFDSASHDLYRPFLGVYREDATLARTPGGIDMGGTDTQRRILSQSIATGPNGSVFVNAQVVAFVDPAAAGTRLTAFDALGEVIAGYPRKLSESSTASQMVVDHTGICYVLESNDGMLYAINPNGSDVAGFPQPVALPADGSYSVAGYSAAENSFDVSITGNLYFVGTARDQPGNPGLEGSTDVFLQSLNTTGAERSGFPVYLSTPAGDMPAAVAMDDAGANAWVAWYIDAGPTQGFVTRIPAN